MWQGSWWKSLVACLDLLDKSANEIAFSTNHKNNKEWMYVNSKNGKFYFYPPLIACLGFFISLDNSMIWIIFFSHALCSCRVVISIQRMDAWWIYKRRASDYTEDNKNKFSVILLHTVITYHFFIKFYFMLILRLYA